MLRRTWFDRLLLGSDVSAKAQEAEERLRKASHIRDLLDENDRVKLDRLGCEVVEVRSEAARARAKSDPPRKRMPSLPELELKVTT